MNAVATDDPTANAGSTTSLNANQATSAQTNSILSTAANAVASGSSPSSIASAAAAAASSTSSSLLLLSASVVKGATKIASDKDKDKQSNTNNEKAANTPTPFRYCMPTHALYTAPVPTARTIFLNFILTKTFSINLSNENYMFLFLKFCTALSCECL